MSDHPLVRGVGLLLLCCCGALSALLQLTLVPLYSGSDLVPVTVLLGVAGNIALPLLARAVVDRAGAMAAPFLCWLVPMVLLALTPRPEGDVFVPGGGGAQWVFYALLLGGIAAGIATIVLSTPRPGPHQGSVRGGSGSRGAASTPGPRTG